MVSRSASSSSSSSDRSSRLSSRSAKDSGGSTRIISGGVASDPEQETGEFPAASSQANAEPGSTKAGSTKLSDLNTRASQSTPNADFAAGGGDKDGNGSGNKSGNKFSLSSLRSVSRATAIRVLLVAVLAGAVGLTSYKYVSDGIESEEAENAPQTSTVEAPKETKGHDKGANNDSPVPFTTADQGSCLTWDVAEDGTISHFEQADCAGPHRFEVAQREDLATYPTSEFGPDAAMPNQTRQAQLREELCGAATVRYLDGRYDPSGRYSIAPILPPAPSWERGDRTMLCGLQETDRAGEPILTSGRVAEQDQSRAFDAGQCVTIDSSNTLTPVDCGEPHHLEITQRVDLAPVFPDHTPSIEEQDGHLSSVCTAAAEEYLGGEENLYQVALQPFWTTQKAASWEGGSRTVNCALVFSRDDGQFADLVGSATAGRDQLRIDGLAPPERPERRPLRDAQ